MPKATLKRVLWRYRRWCTAALAAWLLYWVPLGETLWSIGRSVFEHGASRQTWVDIKAHGDWLLRFFSGPPSDAAMRAFFQQHQAEFERLAYWRATGQCPVGDCDQIEARLGIVHGWGGEVSNSAWRPRWRRYCGAACKIQAYALRQRDQDWWRNTNPRIKGWYKGYLFVPPLLPGSELGEANTLPTDRDQYLRSQGHYLQTSLDQPVPELLAEETYSDYCGYLTQYASYSL